MNIHNLKKEFLVMKILLNGKIYTENPAMPWAEAVAIQGKNLAKVGTNEEVKAFADADAEVIDLEGRVVLPGLIDGHTHPETVSKTYWHIIMDDLTEDLDELLANIKKAVEENPDRPYLYLENYLTETFGDEGPKKELLDTIISDRPCRVQDFGDHACWYNSMAVEMLKDENGEMHVSSPIGDAFYKKDENGEYTGWVLESGPEGDHGIYEAVGWEPPATLNDEMAGPLLDFFRQYGVTCMMDGFTEGEENMKYFYELDKAGKLGFYFDATSILGEVGDLEESIRVAHEWQEKYGTEHIRCNTVKFFLDGTNELGDALSTEPFHNDPTGTNCGEAYCTMEEMRDVMVRLNEENLDLHIHTICDGAFRLICDAAEEAQKICGDDWRIKVTMAHCEIIHPDDIHRVHELGLYIDWSTHWSGGYFGEEAQTYLGMDRWNTMYDFTKIIADGEHVGFSSDVFSYQEAARANPFFGMQTAMTRVDPQYPLDPEKYPGSVRQPESAKLTLEQLIHGYTVTNAIRMGYFDIMGSIEEGKLANLVVLEDDIFNTPAEKIKDINVWGTFFDGEERHVVSTMERTKC